MFFDWFAKVEAASKAKEEGKYRSYVGLLQKYRSVTNDLVVDADTVLRSNSRLLLLRQLLPVTVQPPSSSTAGAPLAVRLVPVVTVQELQAVRCPRSG